MTRRARRELELHVHVPLGLIAAPWATAAQLRALRRIEDANLDCVEYKIRMEEKLTAAELTAAVVEFKRFFALIVLGVGPLAMIGPKVDEVWHQFILFTARYRQFCRATVGRFVNHQPHTPMTPVPSSAWANFTVNYQRCFGPIPEIWFNGLATADIDFFNGISDKAPLRWSGWAGD